MTWSLLKIGATNIPLTRYLVQQGTQSMADRMKVMWIFYPNAQAKDWRLQDGGIRDEIIPIDWTGVYWRRTI